MVVAMEVPGPVLVSNTAEVVAGGVTVVDESVVFVEVAATEVGGTVVVLVEGTVVVLVSGRNSCGGWSDTGCWGDGRDRRISGSDDFGEKIF